MYGHDVFAVLTARDRNNRARTAFSLAHNLKWFHGSTGGVNEAPTIDSRETTPACQGEEGSFNDRLVLYFHELLESDLTDGVRFGSDPKSCHVLLGHRGTKGISRVQYNVIVDTRLCIWLHDQQSTYGTAVEYDGQCGNQVRKKESWILSYQPERGNPFIEIEIHAGSLSFQIEFPNHEKGDARYIRLLQKFVKKSQGLPSMATLDVQSALTTATPSQAQTPSTQALYFREKVIGKGSFGEVCRVIRLRDGAVFASKTLLIPPEKKKPGHRGLPIDGRIARMKDEFRIMSLIKHPNIVNVLEFREDSVPQLILDYYPLGNWNDANIFLEHECVTALGQVLDGLKYLHEKGIAHRDLKPDNILVRRDPCLSFAISDFGLSKLITDTTLLTTFCGTMKYLAPEVFPGLAKSYEPSVDIWSLGVLILEAVYGIPDLPGQSTSNPRWKEWTWSWFQMLLQKLDDNDEDILVDVLAEMIAFEPSDRLNAQSCLLMGFEHGLFELRAYDGLVSHKGFSPEEALHRTTTATVKDKTSSNSEATTVINEKLNNQEGNSGMRQPDDSRQVSLTEPSVNEPASRVMHPLWGHEVSLLPDEGLPDSHVEKKSESSLSGPKPTN